MTSSIKPGHVVRFKSTGGYGGAWVSATATGVVIKPLTPKKWFVACHYPLDEGGAFVQNLSWSESALDKTGLYFPMQTSHSCPCSVCVQYG